MYLYCHNNALTSLDISNNILLANLYCSDNALTSLDASDSREMRHLFCESNALTSLNVANGGNLILNLSAVDNPLLECVEVDDENYSNANWIGLIDDTASYSNNCSIVDGGGAVALSLIHI